jgi:hypothetical protein
MRKQGLFYSQHWHLEHGDFNVACMGGKLTYVTLYCHIQLHGKKNWDKFFTSNVTWTTGKVVSVNDKQGI